MTIGTLHIDISRALIARFAPNPLVASSDITSPATPVAMPLVAFTPTTGVAYLDARPILRAEPQDLAMSLAGTVIHRGIFQIDAVVPDTAGEVPGITLASLVADRFPAGLRLAAGRYFVKIHKSATVAPAIIDAAWVRFPVSIPFTVTKGN